MPRFRQGRLVHLAVLVKRQYVETHEYVGNHVIRQLVFQRGAHHINGDFLLRDIIGHKILVSSSKVLDHNYTILYLRPFAQLSLYLSEFDAVATDFYLLVYTARKSTEPSGSHFPRSPVL